MIKAPIHHLPDEADIGSGEKSPGQRDTEKLIEQVGDSPAQQPAGAGKTPESKTAGGSPRNGPKGEGQS